MDRFAMETKYLRPPIKAKSFEFERKTNTQRVLCRSIFVNQYSIIKFYTFHNIFKNKKKIGLRAVQISTANYKRSTGKNHKRKNKSVANI